MVNTDWALVWSATLSISTALMASAIITTAIFAVVQLRHIKRARYSSLLMQLLQTWDSNEYIMSRRIFNQYSNAPMEQASQKFKEAIKSFDEVDADEFYLIVRIPNFFENLGYLTCYGHLDRKHALELFGETAKRYWELLLEFVKYQRNERIPPQPNAWVYFEYLAQGCPKQNECLKTLKTPISKIRKQVCDYNR
jgi:hypothetical protein